MIPANHLLQRKINQSSWKDRLKNFETEKNFDIFEIKNKFEKYNIHQN